MLQILSNKAGDVSVDLPSSKSVTHRALILASLNEGETEILNPLYSDDTKITLEALRSFGAEFIESKNSIKAVKPIGKVKNNKIFLGNSGSSARFLIPLVLHLDKEIYFHGTPELNKRPFKELFQILKKLGFGIESTNKSLPATVFPPDRILSNEVKVGKLPSSQIISGLMMAFAKSQTGLDILTKTQIPSLPYVKMTQKLMSRLNLDANISEKKISVNPIGKIDFNWKIACEKDLSAASYWVAYSLINNVKVTLKNLLLPSLQGDEAIFEIAELVGGKVRLFSDRVEIQGSIKKGLDYDCEDIPDIVPTLAVMGMFAPEKFVLKNVSRLKYKESDRIKSTMENILALGGKSEYSEPDLIVYPGKNYAGSVIKTFDDHRIAMSFAIAGTKISGLQIDNPKCVEKSYPDFWKDFTEFADVR
jgi:3-phosphoshikimate 1-carboxyvinyltransferase